MPAITILKLPKFDELTKQRGWETDADRARGLGLDPATISRVRAGQQRPGAKFINRCLREFGSLAFDVLFEEVEDAA